MENIQKGLNINIKIYISYMENKQKGKERDQLIC